MAADDSGRETQEVAPALPASVFLRIAFDVLSARAARWAALLGSFILFGAAVWWPDRWRLAAAAGFTVLMAIPVWFKKEPTR